MLVLGSALLAAFRFSEMSFFKKSKFEKLPQKSNGESTKSIPAPINSLLDEEELASKAQLRLALREINDLKHELAVLTKINSANLYRYYSLFHFLPLPCFTINEEGSIVEWNSASSDFFGKSTEHVLGHSIQEILGDSVRRGHTQEAIYNTFFGIETEPVELDISTVDGSIRKVRWIISPIKNEQGKVVGAVNTIAVIKSIAF